MKQKNDSIKNKLEASRILSYNTLIKQLASLYSGEDCAYCLLKHIHSEQVTGDKDVMVQQDANTQNSVTVHDVVTGTATTITIENTCNRTIYLVGIKKKFDRVKGIYYEDDTHKLMPHEKVKLGASNLWAWEFLPNFRGDDIIDLTKGLIAYDETGDISYTQFVRVIGGPVENK